MLERVAQAVVVGGPVLPGLCLGSVVGAGYLRHHGNVIGDFTEQSPPFLGITEGDVDVGIGMSSRRFGFGLRLRPGRARHDRWHL